MRPLFVFFIFCTSISVTAFGQDDDTINYVHGLPETEDIRASDFPEHDFGPKDSVVTLSVDQLPRELTETLEEQPQYKGWRKETIVLDKNTGLYWLHIKDTTTVRSYGFNANGKPVAVRERTAKKD